MAGLSTCEILCDPQSLEYPLCKKKFTNLALDMLFPHSNPQWASLLAGQYLDKVSTGLQGVQWFQVATARQSHRPWAVLGRLGRADLKWPRR